MLGGGGGVVIGFNGLSTAQGHLRTKREKKKEEKSKKLSGGFCPSHPSSKLVRKGLVHQFARKLPCNPV